MVTLRMVVLAVALLLGIPAASVLASHGLPHLPTVPGGQVVEAQAEEFVRVTDVMLADPPQFYESNFSFVRHEQLVEGHTVFATITNELKANVSNATIDITGHIECEHHVNASGPVVFGVPVFNRVHEAHEECRVGETVFVTPDPFVDPNQQAAFSPMMPTFRTFPFTTPSGERGESVEYSFEMLTYDALGEPVVRTLYAWETPIYAPWVGPDGDPKAFYAPLPAGRIMEMGLGDFTVIFADDPRLLFG